MKIDELIPGEKFIFKFEETRIELIFTGKRGNLYYFQNKQLGEIHTRSEKFIEQHFEKL
jgi:hypothetical protein